MTTPHTLTSHKPDRTSSDHPPDGENTHTLDTARYTPFF